MFGSAPLHYMKYEKMMGLVQCDKMYESWFLVMDEYKTCQSQHRVQRLEAVFIMRRFYKSHLLLLLLVQEICCPLCFTIFAIYFLTYFLQRENKIQVILKFCWIKYARQKEYERHTGFIMFLQWQLVTWRIQRYIV